MSQKETCPNCGYCPHCGRAAGPRPIYPRPWPQPGPWVYPIAPVGGYPKVTYGQTTSPNQCRTTVMN